MLHHYKYAPVLELSVACLSCVRLKGGMPAKKGSTKLYHFRYALALELSVACAGAVTCLSCDSVSKHPENVLAGSLASKSKRQILQHIQEVGKVKRLAKKRFSVSLHR